MGQFEDLRLFVTVVENGSITRAANSLNIAKSAVSRRLNLLEERYGSSLIDRQSGDWALTATGQELYARAIPVVADVDEIEQDFSSHAHNLTGPLNVSIPHEFGLAFLSGFIIDFRRRYPQIELTVDFDDRFVDFSRENYDLAVRITTNLQDNAISKRIGTTTHQLCASPCYLAAHGEPREVEELTNHSLLHYGQARRVVWEFRNTANKPVRLKFRPMLNSNSGQFLLRAALDGMGIARLPDFLCKPAISSGALSPLLPELVLPEWGIYLIYFEKRNLNKRMRLFMEEIELACGLRAPKPI